MIDIIKKELSIHNVTVQDNGNILIKGSNPVPVSHAIAVYKAKAKASCDVIQKLWDDVKSTLEAGSVKKSSCPEGIDNMFIKAIQGLKKSLYMYPGLCNFNEINNSISKALCNDINNFSYNTMCRIIELKLAIEWVGHLLAKNLYIKSLIASTRKCLSKNDTKEVIAKGVHGPWSNLDLPMQERVFEWSGIDEEVRGRSRDIQKQQRYTMGLEDYDGPCNEGFEWREIRNEPFLWGKEGENPYPHRNLLWK